MKKKSTDIAKVSYVFVLNIHKGFGRSFVSWERDKNCHNLSKMEEA